MKGFFSTSFLAYAPQVPRAACSETARAPTNSNLRKFRLPIFEIRPNRTPTKRIEGLVIADPQASSPTKQRGNEAKNLSSLLRLIALATTTRARFHKASIPIFGKTTCSDDLSQRSDNALRKTKENFVSADGIVKKPCLAFYLAIRSGEDGTPQTRRRNLGIVTLTGVAAARFHVEPAARYRSE